MKYILKKEYPGSPKLGNIIDNLENDWIENYPEFWKLVVEKDYEILSVITNNNKFIEKVYNQDATIEPYWKIHSVKRLSDSIVFKVGDEVLSKTCSVPNKILSIELINNKIRLYPRNSFYNLEDIKKVKQKLFTTEDGVDIFEGDTIYEIFPTFTIYETKWYNYYGKNGKPLKNKIYFSTKEKAEEYILMNKPVLSLKDVANIYPGINKSHPDKPSSQSERLKNLVKLKIQQSV